MHCFAIDRPPREVLASPFPRVAALAVHRLEPEPSGRGGAGDIAPRLAFLQRLAQASGVNGVQGPPAHLVRAIAAGARDWGVLLGSAACACIPEPAWLTGRP